MKSTTKFPPMKAGKNQTILPSGVKISNDGRYHYWQCSVSGFETFAKPDYWEKLMAKYKTEENLVATYVCRKAQKMLDAGMTQDQIIKSINGPIPAEFQKAAKPVEKKAPAKQKTKVLKTVVTKKVADVDEFMSVVESAIVEEPPVVYPWQGDPNYFRGSPPRPLSIREATDGACAYPNMYLDHDCKGCKFYDECICEIKVSADKWKEPKDRSGPKTRALQMVYPEDFAPVVSE